MSDRQEMVEVAFGKSRAFGSVSSNGAIVDKLAIPFSLTNRGQAELAGCRLEIALFHEGELIAVMRTAPWECPQNIRPGETGWGEASTEMSSVDAERITRIKYRILEQEWKKPV